MKSCQSPAARKVVTPADTFHKQQISNSVNVDDSHVAVEVAATCSGQQQSDQKPDATG